MFAKIGPGRNSKSRSFWLKTERPVTSVGCRSGVHWMREETAPSIDCAIARASTVLAVPGTSSNSTCPPHTRAATTSVICSRLPCTPVSMLSSKRQATACASPCVWIANTSLLRRCDPARSLASSAETTKVEGGWRAGACPTRALEGCGRSSRTPPRRCSAGYRRGEDVGDAHPLGVAGLAGDRREDQDAGLLHLHGLLDRALAVRGL